MEHNFDNQIAGKSFEEEPLVSAKISYSDWDFSKIKTQGLSYTQVKDTLKLLGLNPYKFRKQVLDEGRQTEGFFPDLPDREPKIKPTHLLDNQMKDKNGSIYFLLTGDKIKNLDIDRAEKIIFNKGTNLVVCTKNDIITEATLIDDVIVDFDRVKLTNETSTKDTSRFKDLSDDYWQAGSVKLILDKENGVATVKQRAN